MGTTRNRIAPRLEAGSGLRVGTDLFVVFSPERVSSGRVFADLARYPKLVGGLDPESARRGVALYSAGAALRRPAGSRPAQRGVGPGLCGGRGVRQAGRDDVPGRQHRAGQPVRALRRPHRGRLPADHRGCNSQPFSHLHTPGIAVGGHCIPVYPWFYLAGDPEATIVRAARTANSAMPERAVAAARRGVRRPRRRDRGGARRLLPRRRQGDRLLRRVRHRGGAAGPGRVAGRARPAVRAERARGPRPRAVPRGRARRRRGPAGRPRGVPGFTPADLPGVTVVLDGRGVLDAARWPGVTVVRLGAGDVHGHRGP